MSTRPTRAKRATVPLPEVDDFVEAPKPKTSRGRKRKADDDEPPVDEIEDMLTNPKSRLASVDLNRIINATTWACLSPDARAILCTTLPAAAFPGFQPQLGARHPARRGQQEQSNSSDVRMDMDDAPIGDLVELDPAFLSSPFVTAALTTFQDNLSCGYFSRAHLKELAEYEKGVREGTLHAAWKDDAWDERLKEEEDAPARESRPAKPPPKKIVPRLIDLINDDVVRVGDVLSYDRQFDSGVRIRKDVLVHAIHPRTHALTALFASSTSSRLPAALLAASSDLSSVAHTEVSVTTPAQLETAILSADGRAGRVPRLSAAEASEVAWKSFVLWRAGESASGSGSGSGGGENLQLDSEGPGGRAPAGMLVALRDAWAAGQQE